MKSFHLFFDLDRTLWDFESNSKAALEVIFNDLKLHNYKIDFKEFYNTYVTINSDLWKAYRENKISKTELRIKRFKDTLIKLQINEDKLAAELSSLYIKLSPYQTKLFPNVINVLSELKNQGYTMHIITNGFKEVQGIKLEQSGLVQYFDEVICSEEIGFLKPAKEIFSYSLTKSGALLNNSIMIGDDYKADIMGAQNFGMKALYFTPNKKLIELKEDFEFSNFNQLLFLIPKVFQKEL